MVSKAKAEINLDNNNSIKSNKNNSEMSSFLDEDIIINAEENFRVLTSSDYEETKRFENSKYNFSEISEDCIKYRVLNDKYLEEVDIYEMMPKKVQTEIQNRERIINNLKVSLKELSDKKPIDSVQSFNGEENNSEVVNQTASEKKEDHHAIDNIKIINKKLKNNSNSDETELINLEDKITINSNFKNDYDINKIVNSNKESIDSLLKKKSKLNKDKIVNNLKPNRDNRSSKSSFTNIINNNKNLKNQSKGRNKSNGKIKTIFTIMSEDIFNQVANNSKNKNNFKFVNYDINKRENSNTYDMMVNENFLHKIKEKMSKETKQISNNFLARNAKDAKVREFKKKMNYTTNSEHVLSITRPQSALSSEKPISVIYKNNKERDLKSSGNLVRSPERFYEDQIKWEEAKQSVLERERMRYKDKTNGMLREKPEINKKSVDLATNKNKRFNCFIKNNKKESNGKIDCSDIHCQLTKMKIRNFKKNKDLMYKNLYASPLNQKQLSEKEIKNLIEKLFNEKRKQNKLRSFSNETEIKHTHQYFQIGDSSNLVILKDFLDRLFFTLQEAKLIGEKDKKLKNNLFISSEEFNMILHKAGFLNFDHNMQKVTEGVNEEDIEFFLHNKGSITQQKLKERESVLVKDAWKILISQTLEDPNNLLDLNILIIFLIAILGIYKGDDSKDSNSQNNPNFKTIDLNLNDKSNILLENNLNNNSNEFITKTYNEYAQNYFSNNDINLNYMHVKQDQKNSFGMTFAKPPLGSNSNSNFQKLNQSQNKNILNLSLDNNKNGNSNNLSNSKNAKIRFEEKSNESIKEEKTYLLSIVAEIKKFFPNFNYNNLVYNRYVTNQIRVIFRELYENWANKLFTNKKAKRSISVESKINETNFMFTPKLNKSTILHATKYRNKILSNPSSNIAPFTIEETNSKIATQRPQKIVSLEEIYQNLKIKKERELELERAEKLKKEMQECTFSPKISSRSRALVNSQKRNANDIAEKLYSEARSMSNKKTKMLEERKALEEESINLYPYSPKINPYERSIFAKSPIKNDTSLKINYERYEKSRIDKKLKEILAKTGSNINTIKGIESCLDEEKKDEKRPRFRFDNEYHTHKNTLDSKFKIKQIERISNSKTNNVKSKLFSKSNTKINFNTNKAEKNVNDLNSLDNIIKIVLDVQIAKNKKLKFEFLSNQDPVILTQRFIFQNELSELTEFKKKDIFDQINNEIKKYNKNSRVYLSQIQC